MPPMATVVDSGTLYLAGAGGDIGVGGGGGDNFQLEDLILTQLLIQDARARSCLRSIGTGARCCVNPHLIPGEGLTFKHCGMKTHGSRKWDAPPPEEEFCIPGRGDSIFINPFSLRAELSLDIVDILECTKMTEYRMRKFSQITAPQIQEEK